MDVPGHRNPALPLTRKIVLALLAGLLALSATCYVGRHRRRHVVPTPGMDAEPRFWVRVLLFDDISEFTLSAENGFTVADVKTGAVGRFGKNTQAVLAAPMNGGILIGEHVFGPEIEIRPAEPFVFGLDNSAWRGNLRLTLNADARSMQAVNDVPLESYLAGVIGEEMPSYWEAEALKAQTVAARTYCLFIKYRFGPGRSWDLRRTQANQVYGGLNAESPMVWDAIRATEGLVLVCDQPDGPKIFPAYYSSTCGGHTENSANVFGDSYVSLVGVPCPHCRDITRPTFFTWSSPAFDAEQASRAITTRYDHLRILDRIVAIEPGEVTPYEDFVRLASLRLTGSNGRTRNLRAEDFRLTVDPTGTRIRSNSYRIERRKNAWAFVDGRGFGHAVGLCQYGAEGMARKGADFRTILKFYFPNSELRSIH
jgi:stage II sporulation protein D